MRMLTVVLIVLLSGNFCLAAEQQSTERDQAVVDKQGQAKQGQIGQEQSPTPVVTRDKKSPTWPRPHQSREEISADTVVPFPTDI